ncbi:MAG: YihY/virulence factor BrkB family protein [Bacteroidales bacterium]|nr:YihY/virulence factor BrkB family protein [Bacteroidales bacterium]
MFLNLNRIQEKIDAWSEDLEQIPVLGKIVRKSKTLTLPGFQHIPLYDVMRYFFQSMGKGVIFQRAAALTYRIFIALIPMIIAFFTLIAYTSTDMQNTILSMMQTVVPVYAWSAVEDMITYVVTQPQEGLSTLMFFIGIYFTLICTNGLLAAMNTSYFNNKQRNIFKQIGLSLAIMVIVFFIILFVAMLFIIASMIMNHINTYLIDLRSGYYYLVHGIKWVLVFATVYFMVSILYYLAPVNKENYRFFSAGSSLCTILLVLILWILNIYFSNFSNYNLIYGSLGALFAIVLWLNWSSLILLVCFDLNVSIAKAKETSQCVPTKADPSDLEKKQL